MKKITLVPLGIALLILMLSFRTNAPESSEPASPDNVPLYHTWSSLGEMRYGDPLHPQPLEIPPEGFFPWAGISSHHILAHEYLDGWFSRLAQMRQPGRFYILCPSHYGISIEPYSLTDGSWESGFGRLESDRNKARELAALLEVDLDPDVFLVEHGASALMPYIKKYFPEAQVVVIAYEYSGPMNIPEVRRLADVLAKEFDQEGKRENFLLLSVDFSHGGNSEETHARDYRSQQYLRNTGAASWHMVNCDMLPGIYILDLLGKKNLESSILYHTNSWEISNQDEDDITSYFFVYFADK